MKWKDHYKTLNIPPSSTLAEIKRAYRKLAHKYHPDKNTSKDEKTAERLFLQITESYKILNNPLSKREYDELYHKHQKKHKFSSKKSEDKKITKNNQRNSFQDLVKNVFVNGPDEDTLTQTAQTQVNRKFERGRHLKYQLNLSFEEICDGCEKTITFIRKRKSKNESAKLRIKVPTGITKGKQLRLKGEGDEGYKHYGDLLVVVNVINHKLFKKKGIHAYLDLPITYRQAVLGDRIVIPTLRGVHHLVIPAGTTCKTTFCLKKEGFQSREHIFGDLFVNVQIDIPKDLTAISRKKLEEFHKTLNFSLPTSFQSVLAERMK